MRGFVVTGLVAIALMSGCTLARGTLGGAAGDAAPGSDGGAVDAFTPPIDGAPRDANGEDSAAPVDSGSDTGPAPCVPMAEACNLYDDDCDGATDEDACGCEHREHDGRVYQLCPTATGNQAWGRCTTLGPGYDLVSVNDVAEETWLRDWTMFEWAFIGLEDFARDGTFVWADGSTDVIDLFATGEPNGGLNENCVVTTREGARDITCAASQQFLCEGAGRGSPPPAGASETCNGRDDDLDGPIDEGACDCETSVFDHHVYQRCAAGRTWPLAQTDCRDAGDYAMVRIDTRAESDAMAQLMGGDSWTGLNDEADEMAFVWESAPGEPISSGSAAQGGHFVRWVGAEPNDAGGSHNENCVHADGGGNWWDVPCARSVAYLCERAIAP